MILATMLALAEPAQPAREPYEQVPVTGTRDRIYIPERLGPGPHTLVISDGKAMTRIDYRTGPACQKARDEVRRQVLPAAGDGWTIYAPLSVAALCVPR